MTNEELQEELEDYGDHLEIKLVYEMENITHVFKIEDLRVNGQGDLEITLERSL